MPHQDSPAELQKALKNIIGKMKLVQKKIGSDSQPASMHELDMLSELGQQYADVVERLQGILEPGQI
jgi:hypothetical protein